MSVVRQQLAGPTVDALTPVVTLDELRAARAAVRSLHVADAAMAHAVNLVRATRTDQRVAQGASSGPPWPWSDGAGRRGDLRPGLHHPRRHQGCRRPRARAPPRAAPDAGHVGP